MVGLLLKILSTQQLKRWYPIDCLEQESESLMRQKIPKTEVRSRQTEERHVLFENAFEEDHKG